MRITYESVPGTLADGTKYTLLAPTYEIVDPSGAPLASDVLVSPRIAPSVFGVGLLEAVPEATILANADPDDVDDDGISGRANRCGTSPGSSTRSAASGGRPTCRPSSSRTPARSTATSASPARCSRTSRARRARPSARPSRTAATPRSTTRSSSGSPSTRARSRCRRDATCGTHGCGRESSCSARSAARRATCRRCTPGRSRHRRARRADDPPVHRPAAPRHGRRARRRPPRQEASGREWRTPPLWGIGLQSTVNGHTRFLHDGRARNLEEAILWHGGEGAPPRDAYAQLDRDQREALLAYLRSL